ncbi:MAG: RecQ family ATP-dependent DNA helicase [Acidimicrobiia bacterium]|nr:RecQ family ATP-dependent DNA helicase [Acidimicrobiia bacterium]
MKSQALQLLNRTFGFQEFRAGQEEIVRAILARQDVLAVMPTGSGKSLCYQLPGLLLPGMTLVVSPLIALMKDQVEALERRGIPAGFVNSTLSLEQQQQRIGQMRERRLRIVYVAPERFRSRRFMEGLQECPVSLLAVDEAHCVSEWGHDFRPDYLRLKEAAAWLKRPCMAALTATATPEVRRDIVDQLGLRDPAVFVTGFDRPNLCFSAREVSGDLEKLEALLALLREGRQRGIVYAATRKNVEKVATGLRSAGCRIGIYHAGLDLEERKRTQERFMNGELPMVAATNAFGMGIDKADLEFVVHYDVPGSLEAYYQEVGRAGRNGQPATCLLLFSFADTYTQEFFIEGNCPPLDLIHKVYQTICEFKADDIEVTVREIAERVSDKKANEMAVSSSLKLLEKAGYIQRGTEGQYQARVTLLEPVEALRQWCAALKGLQRPILEYCLNVLQATQGESTSVHLEAMADDLDLSPEELRRGLALLHRTGKLAYQAPFRGRGLQVLQRVPVTRLVLDYRAVERRRQLERRQLKKMVDYAYSRGCLRRFILEYFGETVSRPRCGNCSACKTNASGRIRTLTEAETVFAKKCLSCVARMKGRFGKTRIAQVLTGSRLKLLEQLRLTQLSTYGLLREFTQAEVLSVLDALTGAGLLRVEGTEYPLVQLTAFGRQAMSGQTPIEIDFPLRFQGEPAARRAANQEALDSVVPYHRELYESLRQLRRKWADESKVPPFVILHDQALKEISRRLPATLQELGRLHGIGQRTLTAYGDQVIALVRQFLELRPPTLPEAPGHAGARSPKEPKRPRTVEETCRWWQQGKTVEEIAQLRSLARSTIVGHLEVLFQEGRITDISRIVPPNKAALIGDALAQVEGERLSLTKELLGGKMTYDEIRLVRAASRRAPQKRGTGAG